MDGDVYIKAFWNRQNENLDYTTSQLPDVGANGWFV
jgi:hypothetical protein